MPIMMFKKMWLLAAIVAPALTMAGEPAPQPQLLATTEAILEHCTKVNPEAANQYREQAKLLTQGASEELLAEVRNSEEYRTSYDSALESVSKVDEQYAKKVCAQSLVRNQ